MNSRLNWRHAAGLVVIGLASPWLQMAAAMVLGEQLVATGPPKLITLSNVVVWAIFFLYVFVFRVGLRSAVTGWGICVGISFACLLALALATRAWQCWGMLYSFPQLLAWIELPVVAVLLLAVAARSLLSGGATSGS